MSRQRANLESMNGATAGTYVLPNTRTVTDNFVLEYDNSGYVTVEWDEYRVAARSGYIVKRSQDEDGNDVDWSALTGYLWYWSGTIVTPDAGRFTVTREPLIWYDEQEPTPPIDAENAINLELAYDAIVDTLIAAGGAFQVDERGFAFGDPPPTYDESSDTYSGTGILGNTQGIVGVSGGTVQFEDRVSDGMRTAGAGNVGMVAEGLQFIEYNSGGNGPHSVQWVEALGDDQPKSLILGYYSAPVRGVSIEPNADVTADDGIFTVTPHDGDDDISNFAVIKRKNERGYTAIYGGPTPAMAALSVGTQSGAEPMSGLDVRSHQNFAASGMNHDTAVVTTTNNTITTLFSKTLDDNTVYDFDVNIVARRSDSGTENGIYARRFGVYRQGAGSATLIAAADTVGTDHATTLAATITVDVSSNDVRVRVTGETGKTIEWAARLRWQAVSIST